MPSTFPKSEAGKLQWDELGSYAQNVADKLMSLHDCCQYAPPADEDIDDEDDEFVDHYDYLSGSFLTDAQASYCNSKFLGEGLVRWLFIAAAHFSPSATVKPTYTRHAACTPRYVRRSAMTLRLWSTAAIYTQVAYELVHGQGKWNVATIHRYLKENYWSAERGKSYFYLTDMLKALGVDEALSKFEDPAYGVVLPASPDDQLAQALTFSLAFTSIDDLHSLVTSRPAHGMSKCSNVSHWFHKKTWRLTDLGRDCQARLLRWTGSTWRP